MNIYALAAAIEKNADAFWDRLVSYEEFHTQAGRLWRAAESLGAVEKVSALLRVNQRN